MCQLSNSTWATWWFKRIWILWKILCEMVIVIDESKLILRENRDYGVLLLGKGKIPLLGLDPLPLEVETNKYFFLKLDHFLRTFCKSVFSPLKIPKKWYNYF